MQPIEIIKDGDQELVYVVPGGWVPEKTEFLTPQHLGQQLGMIVYGEGQRIQPHVHLPIVRELRGTTECIVVRKGSCDVDVYNDRKELIKTCRLSMGDTVLFIAGGHGFRMHEDTVLFEIKQGPYAGENDKQRF